LAGVFNIPSSVNFLERLADYVIQTADSLADVVIFLPSMRSCASLRDIFINRALQSGAGFLPLIQPIGDVDDGLEEEVRAISRHRAITAAVKILNEISERCLGKKLHNEQLILFAESILTFMEEMESYGGNIAMLRELHPEELSSHWQQTIALLEEFYARFYDAGDELASQISARQQNMKLLQLAEQWIHNPPDKLIFAAGSTGSHPATARFLSVVSGLPKGFVILHNLDVHSSREAWNIADETSHMFPLKKLLTFMEVARTNVHNLYQESFDSNFITSAMLPAQASGEWYGKKRNKPDNLPIIACAKNSREESEMVAIMCRDALSQGHKSVAVIAPDKQVIDSVATQLAMHNLVADSPVGMPIIKTPEGVFLMQIAECISEGFSKMTLMQWLQNPFAYLAEFAREKPINYLREIEADILHGVMSCRDLQDVAGYLQRVARFTPFCRDFFSGIAAYIEGLNLGRHISFADALSKHVDLLKASINGADEQVINRFNGLFEHLHEISKSVAELGNISISAYPMLLAKMLAEFQDFPESKPYHIKIYTAMEARLLHFDCLIIMGMEEGIWPAKINVDPFLSNGMRAKMGLITEERKCGIQAHDIVNLLGSAKQVYLTNAKRRNGSPTTESRFLLRLKTFAKVAFGVDIVSEKFLIPAKQYEIAAKCEPLPNPDFKLRPAEISATDFHKIMNNPYEFYCHRILRLIPRDSLDEELDGGDYGNVVHGMMDFMVKNFHEMNAANAMEIMQAELAGRISRFTPNPKLGAMWEPSIMAIMDKVYAFEVERRKNAVNVASEVKGERDISLADGRVIKLTARADRIEYLSNSDIAIIDYKTGSPPTAGSVESGSNPQMAIESVIAASGGFSSGVKRNLGQIAFWELKAKAVDINEVEVLQDFSQREAVLMSKIEKILNYFFSSDTPFYVSGRSISTARISKYSHLERVEEWN